MNTRTKTPRPLAALAAVTLTLSLSLVACGDDGDSAAPASATRTASNGDVFNDADVSFATDMIPHHAQAIEMVTLTEGRTLDPEVAAIAEDIRAAQSPEVEQMVDWLTAWGEDVPETSLDHANADHDMGDMGSDEGDEGDGMGAMDPGMPGMMSDQQMTDLEDASDADFQDLWLSMMVEHHTGAITMARAEIDNGRYPAAISLAESIVASQQAEIDRMQALLDS
ncbi:DUF305 domain-containing protein [Nocardioides rubriscoriae]|uniref:DUF305 domain-containing protein n=1 Tax=Nocardioides rubriscoriae TaxID=642762 RepID=UPI0011DF9BD4|nr:DUF305 domain-containing protein [Nocardioides rubriscoriae]